MDADTNEAQWTTYDSRLDDWTKQKLGEDPNETSEQYQAVFSSKYGSAFTYYRQAERKSLVYPEIEIYKDTIIGDKRHCAVYVASKRGANRMELFSDPQLIFDEMTVNGLEVDQSGDEGFVLKGRTRNRMFAYYISDNDPLDMQFVVPKDQSTELVLYEASNDLLTSRHFNLNPRTDEMIPKPFVLNDAILIRKSILIE